MNGENIGSATRGGYTWFHVSPGNTSLSIHDPIIKSQVIAKTVFNAQRGQSYYFTHMLNGQSSVASLGSAPGAVLVSQLSSLYPVSNGKGQKMVTTHKLFGNSLTK